MLAGAVVSRTLSALKPAKGVSSFNSSVRPVTARKRVSKPVTRLFSSDQVEERLKKHGLSLPGAVKPKANYLGIVRSGSLMFLSGHLPYNPPSQSAVETVMKGKLGKDASKEHGALAAKHCAAALLGTLKENINSWEHVRRIVRVTGYVNCVDGYEPLSDVVDGASDLLVDVLGENRGLHARSAVGVSSLPFNASVEVEMIVELDDQFA